MTLAQCESVNSFDKRCNWLFGFDWSLKNAAYPHSEGALQGNECDTVRKQGLVLSKGTVSCWGSARGQAGGCWEWWCCSSGCGLLFLGAPLILREPVQRTKLLPRVRRIKSEMFSASLDPYITVSMAQVRWTPRLAWRDWDLAAVSSGRRKVGHVVSGQ